MSLINKKLSRFLRNLVIYSAFHNNIIYIYIYNIYNIYNICYIILQKLVFVFQMLIFLIICINIHRNFLYLYFRIVRDSH